jgi:hypothetical protein
MIQPGEPPLVVFISSVMNDETVWARKAAVDALTAPPVSVPWAFEYTPASSEPATDTYLAKVRTADVVLWLVTAETTAPVAAEVETALATDRRLWVILLAADRRSNHTESLLAKVRERVKYGQARDADELRALLELTFSDEIIRALRGRAEFAYAAGLEELARSSRARMIERWEATGLQRAEALNLADDSNVGRPDESLLPDHEHPLIVILGDVGAGKSLIAERMLQNAIRIAAQDESKPMPVFVAASDAAAGLKGVIEACAEGLRDPRACGAFVVIDGADEVDQSVASELFRTARRLVEEWPRTHVVVTSRPLPLFADAREVRHVPPLTEDQMLSLVSRVAGREISAVATYGWAESLEDAARRPLFAILLGLARREDAGGARTTGELISFLVTRALGPTLPEALPLLMRLALLASDRGERSIHSDDIATPGEVERLLQSRLVVRDWDLVRFGLPILTQWFAAQALIHGLRTSNELLDNTVLLDRWRYALAIAVATTSSNKVDALLEPLARSQPGFASVVIAEAVRQWSAEEDEFAIESLDAARALRTAFVAWDEGLSPISHELFPHEDDGDVATVAASAGRGWVDGGWYLGESPPSERVARFPPSANLLRPIPDWDVRKGSKASGQGAWHWHWTLDLARADLNSLVAHPRFLCQRGALRDEATWVAALDAMGRGSLSHEPVPLRDLHDRLDPLPPGALFQRAGGRVFDVDVVRERLKEIADAGSDVLLPPWPAPDLSHSGSGRIWGVYSDSRQLERVRAVYRAAMIAYEDFVRTWFPRLAMRLATCVTLPARLVGDFVPGERVGDSVPVLKWYLEPLSEGAENEVDIELRDPLARQVDPRRVHEHLVAARPDAAGWIGATVHHGIADVFQGDPLTELVLEWLRRDLRDVKWGK